MLIPTIVFHEVSHGIVAYWCGDDTAKVAGRLSANPIRHLDPVGSVIVPIGLVLLGGPGFGWAKPVPVSLNRLRHPRNQALLVALAGPASNALVATVCAVAMYLISRHYPVDALTAMFSVFANYASGSGVVYWVVVLLGYLGLVNVFLGAFNLIPIPPLDGSAVLERFIPIHVLPTYYRVRMAFMVLLIAIFVLDRNVLGGLYAHLAQWYMDRAGFGGLYAKYSVF